SFGTRPEAISSDLPDAEARRLKCRRCPASQCGIAQSKTATAHQSGHHEWADNKRNDGPDEHKIVKWVIAAVSLQLFAQLKLTSIAQCLGYANG
ncbi:hypothetical protein HaLaN_08257, partial [Haematococcus lacustris]